jgi:hypothetical protein
MGVLGLASRISQMSASEMIVETKSSSSSEIETLELLQSMSAVKGSLETSADQVQGIVNTPRMLAAQIAKLKLEDEAQLLVFHSLESVLKRVQIVENSMSDDELATVLEELSKIAKTWVEDREKLVNDLAQAKKESEEMKKLALTACYEASSVVDRAESHAKSRLEAKRRVKAENKVLLQKNMALMSTCVKLTEEHAAELTQISEVLNTVEDENSRIRRKMEEKLEVMAYKLMKTVVVETPFRQWRALVQDVQFGKLAQQQRQEVVDERTDKCSKVHEVYVPDFLFNLLRIRQNSNTIPCVFFFFVCFCAVCFCLCLCVSVSVCACACMCVCLCMHVATCFNSGVTCRLKPSY